MPFTLYRADNRAPDSLAATGFQSRIPMDLETTHALVRRALIDPSTPLKLPVGEKPYSNALSLHSTPALLGLGAMYTAIRNERSHGTTHVSTARDEDCMGADAGYTYRIELPMQRLYAWDNRGHGISATPREINAIDQIHLSSIHPVLLTDSDRIENARMIAISDRNGEVAFQTPIPSHWITHSRESVRVNQPEHPWIELPRSPIRDAAPGPTPAAHSSVHAMSEHTRSSGAPPVPPKPATLTSHPYGKVDHERHSLYAQALGCLADVQSPNLRSSSDRSQAAAALADAAAAVAPSLRRIDSVASGDNGRLFAIQGRPDDPSRRHVHVDPAQIAAGAHATPSPASASQTHEDAPRGTVQSIRDGARELAPTMDVPGPATNMGAPGPRR